MITLDLLRKLAPTTPVSTLTGYLQPLVVSCEQYSINTPRRIAHFLSQCAHESGNFQFIIENLNYSASGLLSTFPKYFTKETANSYARLPQKIGSRVYADRMGNGPEASGDGYKYRGRGLIQLTGKNNYTQFSKDIGKPIEEAIIYMETKPGAVHAALWFWDVNKLATLSDIATVDMITRKVNGGLNGYTDRLAKYKLVLDHIDKK